MSEGNFQWFISQEPKLAEIGECAERDFHDPNVAVGHLRLFGELLSERVVAGLGLPRLPQESQFDRLERLAESGVVPRKVLDRLHQLRILGNRAVHERGCSKTDATGQLRSAWELVTWYIAEFFPHVDLVRPPFKTPGGPNPAPSGIPVAERSSDLRVIDLVVKEQVHYALALAGMPLIDALSIENMGEEAVERVLVRVDIEPAMGSPGETWFERLNPGEKRQLSQLDVSLSSRELARLTERGSATLTIKVTSEGTLLCAHQRELDLLPYNHWPGLSVPAELLAVFIQPNEPSLMILQRAVADILQEFGESPSLEGYQAANPARVRKMLFAVYGAIQRLDITYTNPPASFEHEGQKIRLVPSVLSARMGTCLDLAVLAAASLEQAGLHPLVMLVEGHAFVGVWLGETHFPEPTVGSAQRILQRMDLGEIAVVDITSATARPGIQFDDAADAARRYLEASDEFFLAVDVKVARLLGIHPLPSETELHENRGCDRESDIPLYAPRPDKYVEAAQRAEMEREEAARKEPIEARLERWRNKLLDLSLRNRFLNYKESRRSVPLIVTSAEDLCEGLGEGRTFSLHADGGTLASPPPDAYLDTELGQGRLHVQLTEAELQKRLLELSRQARVSIEDGGVNTLFLAMGLLQWTPSVDDTRFAPLLLVPVRLSRQGARAPFRLERSEDENQLNVTLLHKLNREYGIDTRVIQDLVDGEETLDTSEVFRRFREAVAQEPSWRVREDIHLSLFSFAKFVMWNDLTARSEEILANPIVQQILVPGSQPSNEDERSATALSQNELLCPLDADSTQVKAVASATRGETFVLHGPPGSGKSQTITNIIACALGEGKKVLFVSEKMAALEVVHRRLEGIGLGAFCIELHSNKASKREVIAQFSAPLQPRPDSGDTSWASTFEQLATRRAVLDAYTNAIRRERALGCNVFWATSYLTGLQNAPLVRFRPHHKAHDITAATRSELREDVDRFVAALNDVGSPQRHPWRHAQRAVRDAQGVEELHKHLAVLKERLEAVRSAYEGVRECLGLALPQAPSNGLLGQLAVLSELCVDAPAPTATMLKDSPWPETAQHAQKWLDTVEHRQKTWSELEPSWQPALLRHDLDLWRQRVRKWAESFFLVAFVMLWGVRRALEAFSKSPKLSSNTALRLELDQAIDVRETDAEIERCTSKAANLLGVYWDGRDTDVPRLRKILDWVSGYRDARDAVGASLDVSASSDVPSMLDKKLVEQNSIFNASAPWGEAMSSFALTWRAFNEALQEFTEALDLDVDAQWSKGQGGDYLTEVSEVLSLWSVSIGRLREWSFFLTAREALREKGGGPLVEAALAEEIGPDEVGDAFERGFHRWWLDEIIDQDKVLNAFGGVEHSRQVGRFIEEDGKSLSLSALEVRARLFRGVPQAGSARSDAGELAVLLRELNKKRRHMPVRQLLKRIPHLMGLLKPCFLMSPLSIAQYLEPGTAQFDLVVFDEASQIPCADAIGAIARGRQLVVVGDPKQLPPTNFFQKLESEDEVDEDDFDESESILDECIASGMMQRYLGWHYRSRHESLITFSNKRYYNGRLHTFPAPVAQTAETGLTWSFVQEGVYDRGGRRTNRPEAEALVAELIRRLKEKPEQTLGVVTFSKAQQGLVEDLIEAARHAEPELEYAFTEECEERVFVKNLENVQGDERDVILFSICYGPTAGRDLSMNFGPLNRPGGERRLNVAVTRARHELVVFSSMTYQQIDPRRTRARGVLDLRQFLAYAQGEALNDDDFDRGAGEAQWPIIDDIAQVVRELGYRVHTQVGMSDYRVDVAVCMPDDPESYLLGIECDGPSYHQCLYARDRDRLRASVMERMGWRLHRVWSPEWLANRGREQERIEVALEEALRALNAPSEDASEEGVEAAEPLAGVRRAADVPRTDPEIVAAVVAHFNDAPSFAERPGELPGARPYRPASIRGGWAVENVAQLGRYHAKVRAQVKEVIATEQPISLDLVSRRVADAWGLRKSKNLSRLVRSAMLSLLSDESIHLEQDGQAEWLWLTAREQKIFSGFRYTLILSERTREAVDIHPREIAHAAKALIEASHSLSEKALLDDLKRVFGFKSLGTRVKGALSKGLLFLTAKGYATRSEDGTYRS